jgi:hypothetical protein
VGLTTTEDLEAIERTAAAALEDEVGRVEADLDATEAPDEAPEEATGIANPVRVAVAIAFPVTAAALMVGGIYSGAGARIYGTVAGLLGVGLALLASRSRRPFVTNASIGAGVFAIGLLMVVPAGAGHVFSVSSDVSQASHNSSLLRPPVPLTPGWQAVIGWLLGTVGFAAGWTAIKLRRGPLGLLVPIPVAAVAAISVPKDAQVASGIVTLALFAVGLGLLFSAQQASESEERVPLSYELRKAARSIPLIALITAGLFGLSQAHFLFPKPAIDPAQQPQRPKTVPLTKTPDRVLFEVESSISGPWRMGSLDVYDGADWRLPPFGESKLKPVPRSGIVDPDLTPGIQATFTTAGIAGTVLPGLPNTAGVVANGPRLAFDKRTGTVRVAQGAVQAGLTYTLAAPGVPSIEELEKLNFQVPKDLQPFAQMPTPMPRAVADLVAKAPTTNKWDEFDYLRTWILDNVTASGAGTPKSVTADRVADMIAGSKQGSPFEIVAAQAMLGRWIGLPSRIGYGFDGGDQVNGKFQVRPRNGATFVEVWFPGFKWLPVIGTPKLAKPTVGDTSLQQTDPNVQASNDISVSIFVPTDLVPRGVLAENLRTAFLVLVLLIVLAFVTYLLLPLYSKAATRSRRRAAARASGPRARIALAYAEWRDSAADFGVGHPTDTPLQFLTRFAEDDEHSALAWLVTRALWGDLQGVIDETTAADAEELSKALQRRLAGAQPMTSRLVARLSRTSMRNSYAPDTDLTTNRSNADADAA